MNKLQLYCTPFLKVYEYSATVYRCVPYLQEILPNKYHDTSWTALDPCTQLGIHKVAEGLQDSHFGLYDFGGVGSSF